MTGRLALLAFIAIAAAPGTWLRDAPAAPDYRDRLAFAALDIEPQALGEVRLEGAWEMTSAHPHFGSWSALVSLGDGTLLAASDRGRLMRFAPPGEALRGVRFLSERAAHTEPKKYRDLESLTRDPASGAIWAGYESRNVIARLDSAFAEQAAVRPEAMASWPSNSGAETLVRLADGRFLVIAEGRPGEGDGNMPALLFPGDPLKGGSPQEFAFRPPDGMRPVDGAQLPNGRLLILVRMVVWGVPPRFESALVLTGAIGSTPPEMLSGAVIARFSAPLPSDNFEGLAIAGREDGGATAWLVSDDNDSAFQRSLLVRLAIPAGLSR